MSERSGDEETGSPGQEGMGNPSARGDHRVRAPREELYAAMWVAYRDGVRQKDVLKRMFKVSWATVNAAIEQGWPEKEWACFKDRLELWERQKGRAAGQVIAEQDRRAAEVQGRTEAEGWAGFQPKAMAMCAEGNDLLAQLAAKLRDAVKAASFVRYRKVRQVVTEELPNGEKRQRSVTVDQPYVDGLAVAQAARTWASAARENGQLMSFLTGGPTSRTEVTLPELTPDQIQALRGGQLPDGVSLAMVAQAVLVSERRLIAGGEE